jgi:hypothetical protein
MSQAIEAKIAACENYIAMMREDLAVNEKHLYGLYLELQQESAHEEPVHEQALANVEEGSYEEAMRHKEMDELLLMKERIIDHPIGTKLKWVLNEETYRVAIVKKNGILQVKSVTDGAGDCHEDCGCARCHHAILFNCRRPLKKRLFANEFDWQLSLPSGGDVIATNPITDAALKKISCAPLVASTEPLQLKELHQRFPGGVFVLSTDTKQMEVEYFFNTILCRKENVAGTSFKDFGVSGKPNLMVEWNGLYISLSHLF